MVTNSITGSDHRPSLSTLPNRAPFRGTLPRETRQVRRAAIKEPKLMSREKVDEAMRMIKELDLSGFDNKTQSRLKDHIENVKAAEYHIHETRYIGLEEKKTQNMHRHATNMDGHRTVIYDSDSDEAGDDAAAAARMARLQSNVTRACKDFEKAYGKFQKFLKRAEKQSAR